MQPEPEPESGAGWQGRGVRLRGKEGAQGEGVSHGRAPAGARLERGLREPRPPPAPRAPCLAAGPNGSRRVSSRIVLRE